jgi:hypothetical protein
MALPLANLGRGGKQGFQPGRGQLLHSGYHVGIGVQRQRDSAVAEPFLHDLGVLARRHEQRGVGVAQIVKPEGWAHLPAPAQVRSGASGLCCL